MPAFGRERTETERLYRESIEREKAAKLERDPGEGEAGEG
jgi:hypothetical protein